MTLYNGNATRLFLSSRDEWREASSDLSTITENREVVTVELPGFGKKTPTNVGIRTNISYDIDGMYTEETQAGLLNDAEDFKVLIASGSGKVEPVAGDLVEYMPDAIKSAFSRDSEQNELIALTATFMVGEDMGVLDGQLVYQLANHADSGSTYNNTPINLVANQPYYLLMWGEEAGVDARDNVDFLVQSSGGGGDIGTGNTLLWNEKDMVLNGPHTPTTDGIMRVSNQSLSGGARTWGLAILYERD